MCRCSVHTLSNSALVLCCVTLAGMLSAEAQRERRSRASISEWWPAAADALRARASSQQQHSMLPWLSRRRFSSRALGSTFTGLGRSTGWPHHAPC